MASGGDWVRGRFTLSMTQWAGCKKVKNKKHTYLSTTLVNKEFYLIL